MEDSVENVILGLEMSLMTQEQVVSTFRDLMARNPTLAVQSYGTFNDKLEHASSDDNAQIRSMIGGPDSHARAGLINIMSGSYATASPEVKTSIRNEVVRPLVRDNDAYVRPVVARIADPYLVTDIIREYPAYNPGLGHYEDELLKSDKIDTAYKLVSWLRKFDHNLFAATTIALQKNHPYQVSIAMNQDPTLFEDAAHVAAGLHDLTAEIRIMSGATVPKGELTSQYRAGFVDEFALMIEKASAEARWVPIGAHVLALFDKGDVI